MRKESRLYASLKEAIGEGYFLQRIENQLDVGVPDLFFASSDLKGAAGWMELKVLQLPVKSSSPVRIPFRPGQIGWAHKAIKAGVLYVLLVWTDKGYFAFDGRNVQDKYTLLDFYRKGTRFITLRGTTIQDDGFRGFREYMSSLGRKR